MQFTLEIVDKFLYYRDIKLAKLSAWNEISKYIQSFKNWICFRSDFTNASFFRENFSLVIMEIVKYWLNQKIEIKIKPIVY